MASSSSSPLNSKSHFHARSNSLPSRPHPLILQCHEHLDRLTAFNDNSSSSSSPLSQKRGSLKDLHDCVEKLVQLPLAQETLLQEHHENFVDKPFDGSLRLLEARAEAKDVLHYKRVHTRTSINYKKQKRKWRSQWRIIGF